MTRTFGAFVLLSSLLAACGVGDEGAESDNRDTQLGILCNAMFLTSGTFTAALPARPADQTGCWPVGTWTFTATVDSNECPAAPSLLGSYSFKVDRAVNPDPTKDIGYEESYSWLGDQAMFYRLGVTSTADGCEGGLELYSADGKEYWNFKPLLLDNGTIGGFGEFAKYATNQKL